MKFIPLYERVLVQEMKGAKAVDGFALPDNARDDFLMGVVVSVGEGYAKDDGTIRPLRVKEGMTVLFGPHAGTKVQVNCQEYLSMREGEIVGWLE
ncbi:MAG TPA: co-chaperone GroES [Candidatus Angelobacter sp.]|nr:co-chaperone GroES [Candidatus Angelobacter sp.]